MSNGIPKKLLEVFKIQDKNSKLNCITIYDYYSILAASNPNFKRNDMGVTSEVWQCEASLLISPLEIAIN